MTNDETIFIPADETWEFATPARVAILSNRDGSEMGVASKTSGDPLLISGPCTVRVLAGEMN